MRGHSSFWVLGVGICLTGIMLFWNLGNYSLWDDEAIDGLIARSLLENGRAEALIGKNLVGYRDGALLHGMMIEGEPPFCAFAAIPFFGIFGQTPWAARAIPALAGFATACLMLLWAFQVARDSIFYALFCMALLFNTSFFLFSRQFHYYGPSMFFVTAIAYLWVRPSLSSNRLLWIGLCFFCLNLSNYLTGFLVSICIAVDYIIFRRTQQTLRIRQLLPILIPFLLSGVIIYLDWNPFLTSIGGKLVQNSLQEKITLSLWGLRDLNQCEFVSGLLLALWPWILIRSKDPKLLRMTCFLGVFFLGICLFSTQPVQATSVFDVRYLIPILPFLIFLSAYVVYFFLQALPRLALVVGLVVLGTNLTHRIFPFAADRFCTTGDFFHELIHPVPEPFDPVITWLKKNVPSEKSVWVLPEHMTYPLMFHAPEQIYAWQFAAEKRQDLVYRSLPDIHFRGIVPPDYVVIFGPMVVPIREMLSQMTVQGIHYSEVTRLLTFWKDLYRPELFWRTFKPIENFDPNTEGIYIFKKQS